MRRFREAVQLRSTSGASPHWENTAMKTKTMLIATLALLVWAAYAQTTRTLPSGSEIKVRTDAAIPAKPVANATYTATVSDDVMDSSGAVAIPRGSRAKLVAQPTSDGKDTNLDLRSVTINNQRYSLETQTQSGGSAPGGLGANKRTGKY